MATTDFLLRPSPQSSLTLPTAQEQNLNKRTVAPAPAQSFSTVYAQQQHASKNQQQQLQNQQRSAAAVQEKQQQAARQATAKNTAQPVKDKPVASPTDTRKPQSGSNSDAVKDTQKPTSDATVSKQGGKDLPQETVERVEESEEGLLPEVALPVAENTEDLLQATALPTEESAEDLLDPLLMMAINATAAEYADNASMKGFRMEAESFSKAKVSSELSDKLIDLEAEPAAEEVIDLEESLVKTDTQSSTDKATLLSSALGKTADSLIEKGTTDKNTTAAMLETIKAAPETLLNNKAVTANEAIRTDLLSSQEPLSPAQQVRQVPGPAVAMQQPGWTQDVTDKVMWMSSQNLKSAEIKLDPAELGRLDIKIDISQEHTQITFSSAHAAVRESLETQMYRLRELFAQQGMENLDVNVSDQSQQQAQAEQQTPSRGNNITGSDSGEEAQQQVSHIREQHDGNSGLVDYYA